MLLSTRHVAPLPVVEQKSSAPEARTITVASRRQPKNPSPYALRPPPGAAGGEGALVPALLRWRTRRLTLCSGSERRRSPLDSVRKGYPCPPAGAGVFRLG